MASAKQLLLGDPPLYDTSVYHCQQAAEKALKAFLTWRDKPFKKVHDLMMLTSECKPLDHAFTSLEEAAEILTPYGTAFRYPGSTLEPEPDESKEAVDLASRVLDFVKYRLPAECHPGTSGGSS